MAPSIGPSIKACETQTIPLKQKGGWNGILARFALDLVDPLIVTDQSGQICFTNSAGITLLRKSSCSNPGFVPADWLLCIERSIQDGSVQEQIVEVDARHLALRIQPLDRLHVSIHGRDVTGRRHASETLAQALYSVAELAEQRDPSMRGHISRIQQYAQLIAESLALQGPHRDEVSAEFLRELWRASPLHDIGRLSLPDSILANPGRLSQDEFDCMKQHTIAGAEILERALSNHGDAAFARMATRIARSHHERYDGLGYPDGLAGPKIPLAAQIVSVADTYDALTSPRVYRHRLSAFEARDTILAASQRQFNPAVVAAFEASFDRICAATSRSQQ